jgi:Galactose mutarotase and related enzymes
MGSGKMIDYIKNNKLQIGVKRLGAELTSIKTVEDNLEFLWQGDKKYWGGQAYILFPIIGGLPDNKYELDGKTYEMKSHGFARGSEFELFEKSEDRIVYRLKYSEDTLKQYPFRFDFFVSYTIKDNILYEGFKVVNLDEKEMLFSVGGHPGFNCPLYENEKMEDYWIAFEKSETLQSRIKKEGLLNGEKVYFMEKENKKLLEHSLFYAGAAILDGVQSEWLELRNSKNNRVIRVDFSGFTYLGIWSSANDGPYVCIEPWYGIDSTKGESYDLTKKEGLQRLQAGGCFERAFSITIK